MELMSIGKFAEYVGVIPLIKLRGYRRGKKL